MNVVIDSNRLIPLAQVKPGDIVKYHDVQCIVTGQYDPSRTSIQLVSLRHGSSIVAKDNSIEVQLAKTVSLSW